MGFSPRSSGRPACLLAGLVLFLSGAAASATEPFTLQPHDRVVILGNGLAERMQYFHHFETLLHARHPEHQLTVRNLGWSGDSVSERLRSQDFQDHGHTLADHQPNVIIACFGFNESFAGPAGETAFERQLTECLQGLKAWKYSTANYRRGSYTPVLQDKTAEHVVEPRIVLVSPIPAENLPERGILAADRCQENLRRTTEIMRRVAAAEGVRFADVFTPMAAEMEQAESPLTINGVHLSSTGDAVLARVLDSELFGAAPATDSQRVAAVQREVAEKNLQFFYDYRAVNGFYIYGGRKEPFGVVNFPAEFAKLRKMTAVRDARIWAAAQGRELPEQIDDSATGDFVAIETNQKNPVHITSPEESAKMFTLADGFEISLWASEVEFPDLANPVQFAFDARGRLWVTTMPSYPMVLPGTPVDDKVLILEDRDGDHRADSQKIFARGLHLPTGIELGDHGAYVAQQPNLAFLPDRDGDDVADSVELRLHGFDSADSHHALSAFEWGPAGELYFLEGTFHHSQSETPAGPRRLANSGVFRYEPRPEKLDVFVSYDFANPWGMCFDAWGQNFVADASGGDNYFAAGFSGDLDHPRKHPSMKRLLEKQWRPTCGCEFVSSRNFPEAMQGDYLLNNCIGFQGVLQYRPQETGSGFFATPVAPLLRSADPNFRPVDLQFGPDGALYILDWFNPLVGHMQHSLRDPLRDTHHGRIWRVVNKDGPLITPPQIAGATLPDLLALLQAPEDRTRYRVRRELRDRPTADVLAALDNWTAALKTDDPLYEHSLLEACWVKQQHDVLDTSLLTRLLQAEDGRVRAAGVRVLCYARDRVENPLQLLQAAVNDAHPRVRLEAVRALSFFDSQAALDIAVESLVHEQDDYLEYVLQETLETLQRRVDGSQSASATASE